MREIVLDTETTGLRYDEGHKIVEIGCLELCDCLPTGQEFHTYLDPRRDISAEASKIHGIDAAFVEGKPTFPDIAQDLLNFLNEAPLVIHNAAFDMGFLNGELQQAGRDPLNPKRVVDTLALAQQKFPGERASLDALCRRFSIDISARLQHGALLDARLLAQVYLELCGGRQHGIDLSLTAARYARPRLLVPVKGEGALRVIPPSDEEMAAHKAVMQEIAKLSSKLSS